MRNADYYVVDRRENRKVLDMRNPPARVPAARFPWHLFAFGFARVDADQFTIKGGEIQIGTSAPVTVTDTGVTITVDGSYVGWEYRLSTGALSIQNFGSSITYEDDYIRKWLYKFSLSSGYAKISEYGWLNPSFPAMFAGL